VCRNNILCRATQITFRDIMNLDEAYGKAALEKRAEIKVAL
jgi:hypothetical protein